MSFKKESGIYADFVKIAKQLIVGEKWSNLQHIWAILGKVKRSQYLK